MKAYLQLTKFGIALFVMITGLAGYAVGFPMGQPLEIWQPIVLVIGLYFVSSGSFALNQAQEWQRDRLMERTAKRPVASGMIASWQAYTLSFIFILVGVCALALFCGPMAALLAFLTVVLYNGLYTLLWKRRWVFGAVPGAIPGAMPVVIGFASTGRSIFSPECVYLFLIMFLWQMPHFWSLAIRFKQDYERGGFPVLPARLGDRRALYHIGLYTFTYVGVALVAPWFLQTHILHVLLVVPLALKVIWEFWKYFHSDNQKQWLPFFLWINLSMLVFVTAPVFDRWIMYWMMS